MLGLKEYKLSQLLNETLGSGKISKTEWIHHSCPFCHHHKPKLQVSLTEHAWHCWVCDVKGRNIYALFKKANASVSQFEKLKEIYPERVRRAENAQTAMTLFGIKSELFETPQIELPKSFSPLWSSGTSIIKNIALSYLKGRGITKQDIIKHNIGYCENNFDFEYNNKIIIPSYDSNEKLNFFEGRSFLTDDKFPHKLPAVSKDIIGFELFINWNEPLVICEGSLDALAVKRNAIPLFGKIMSNKLILSIVENGVKRIYLALDNDALKSSLKITKQLEGFGVEVFIPQFVNKDPSATGFTKVEKILNSTRPMDFSSFISMKLAGK